MTIYKVSRDDTYLYETERPFKMFVDDDKISYKDYIFEASPSFDSLENNNNVSNQQVEECECEWNSEFMADMPTNDSYSISDDEEGRENYNAEKYLIEIGMLVKADDAVYFDLNFRSDHSTIEEFDTISKASQKAIKSKETGIKFFEDPFGDTNEFNPAETLQKQLEKDPLPMIQAECIEDEKFLDLNLSFIPDIEVDSVLNMSDMSINQPQPESPSDTFQNSDKMNNNNNSKKKLTEFNYLLQRKGFRLMRKYYKEKFESFAQAFNYKKRVKTISPGEINQIIAQFIQSEFSAILSLLTNNELEMLLESLKWVIFSDRSNKSEFMTQGIDFSVVKNLFGKYTKKNMVAFMRNAANSFLYTHFYLINGRSAWFEQKDVDQDNFKAQMRSLMLEAFKSLFTSVKPLYENLYQVNASKL